MVQETGRMQTNNLWIYVTIAVIWITVAVASFTSPELQFGTEPEIFNVAAMVDWFWGLLGTVFVMRSTVFRRPHEAGYGQDEAWGFVALTVSGIWVAAMLVSVAAPTVTIGDDIFIPAGAIVAPIVAAALTPYACEFLVEGVAARLAGRAGV
jgi:hypothetical protein